MKQVISALFLSTFFIASTHGQMVSMNTTVQTKITDDSLLIKVTSPNTSFLPASLQPNFEVSHAIALSFSFPASTCNFGALEEDTRTFRCFNSDKNPAQVVIEDLTMSQVLPPMSVNDFSVFSNLSSGIEADAMQIAGKVNDIDGDGDSAGDNDGDGH